MTVSAAGVPSPPSGTTSAQATADLRAGFTAQNPGASYDECKNRLGNLTLLENGDLYVAKFTGDGDDVLGLSGATHGTLVTRGRRSRHRRRSGDVDLPQRVPYMSRSRACSCSDFTAYEPCMLASMACTAAASSCTVVRIGAFIDVPAARIA